MMAFNAGSNNVRTVQRIHKHNPFSRIPDFFFYSPAATASARDSSRQSESAADRFRSTVHTRGGPVRSRRRSRGRRAARDLKLFGVDVSAEAFPGPAAAGIAILRSGNSSMAGAGLEPWRELFRGRDIYDVIGKAILIAATDSPKEFRRRRDGIVEQIYMAPAILTTHQQGSSAGDVSGSAPQVSEKGSKVASCTVAPPEQPEDDENDAGEGMAGQNGNGNGDNANAFFSGELDEMDWLQTLADDMDAEAQEIDEVHRIKGILLNHHQQSADILFESLRRLQLMQLSVDKIKSTEIGRAVSALRKHKLHKIRTLVCEIIKGWKAVVDDWTAATKATMDGDSNKSLDASNPLAAEDEGGLATPPMDVGALFLVSQATAMQNVSEFLHGMDDDGIITNVITDLKEKGGGCGSNCKYDGAKPTNTAPCSEDTTTVQAVPVTRKLPGRQRIPSSNTNPPQKLLNAPGNSLLGQQGRQSDLTASQESAMQETNIQKVQEQGSKVPRVHHVRIKIKHSSSGNAPRRLSEETLDKKPCEQNQGTVSVTRNPPIVVAAGDLPSGQIIKTGIQTQSSAAEPKLSTWKRKVQLSSMNNLDETKRKLQGAYQEAENAKKKRVIQVVELCDIAKSKDVGRTPLTTSLNTISRTTNPLTKSMNHISSRTPSIKQKSHSITSWEHDQCK